MAHSLSRDRIMAHTLSRDRIMAHTLCRDIVLYTIVLLFFLLVFCTNTVT